MEANAIRVNKAFHRLCSLMRKMDVKSAIIEDVDTSYGEVQSEVNALKIVYQDIEFKIYRFTFIYDGIDSLGDIKKIKEESFLSSNIIINYRTPHTNWQSYLYYSIVVQPHMILNGNKLPLLNNYLHVYKKFQCNVLISDTELFNFHITGSYFCQQNEVTSVCAHAALCMTINNMNFSFFGLEEIEHLYPERINNILGINHIEEDKKASNGLSTDQIKTVLEEYKLKVTIRDFFNNFEQDYNEFVYQYIESRCPVLLIFSTNTPVESHVVPILGHTLNSDMWRPEAEPAYLRENRLENYKLASAWIDHFIIHDDNFGMYFCMPIESLKRTTIPKYDPAFRAQYAIVVIPEKVNVRAFEAEWNSILHIRHVLDTLKQYSKLDDWSERLRSYELPTVRTFLVKKEDYVKSLDYKDYDESEFLDADKQSLLNDLPEMFWLSEITLPDLYTANKTKLADVFYKCSVADTDTSSKIIQIRLPHRLFKFKIGNVEFFQMNVGSHYPLLRFESENAVFDW